MSMKVTILDEPPSSQTHEFRCPKCRRTAPVFDGFPEESGMSCWGLFVDGCIGYMVRRRMRGARA